jgi:hypothetical protein
MMDWRWNRLVRPQYNFTHAGTNAVLNTYCSRLVLSYGHFRVSNTYWFMRAHTCMNAYTRILEDNVYRPVYKCTRLTCDPVRRAVNFLSYVCLLTPWLYDFLRILASFTTDAHFSFMNCLLYYLFSFSARKSSSSSSSYLSLGLPTILLLSGLL